ncbi:c-type cytochrome [Palleronia pelagia]|uniref:Cytochrome c556 n=1 Tax=Palleronia pelagia TaxID=387096 RepID=A0A1H8BY71_9RHOB|nr:cytochrome c [Palleronia pelagia]SEM87094.1 Cytochrome c556 [Palleronia pelagia]
MKRYFGQITVVAGILVAVSATAQANLEGPVKARKQHMQLYGFNLGTLGDMAKGDREYDAALAQAAADRLVALSAMTQAGYYPAGTSSDEMEDSRALPVLFEQMDDYQALTNELNAAAEAMAAVAGDGVEQVQANMQALGQACGACHEDYRKPRE